MLKTFLILLLFSIANIASFAKSIDIGLIFRFDDKFNKTTQSLMNGFQLARDQFNKKNSIQIHYKLYSHNETTQSVIKATKKALADNVKILIGGENSDESLAIARTIRNKDVVLITPTSTNPSVTLNNLNVFRTCFSDDDVADKLAELIHNKFKSKIIGILHNVSYPYSNYLSKRIKGKLEELNSQSLNFSKTKPKIFTQKVIRNQKDFSKEVKFFKSNNIEHMVILSFQSDLLRFYAEAVKKKFFPIYIGSDGWGSNDSIFQRMGEKGLNRTKFQAYRNIYWKKDNTSRNNQLFIKKYQDRFQHSPDAWSAIAYDTAKIVFQAIEDNKTSSLLRNLKDLKIKNLLTTESFEFARNNSPNKDLHIYRIDSVGVHFYETIKK